MTFDVYEGLDRSLGGRYRIERELGAGGMATVYLAEDVKHHRRVAIKVLHAELSAVLGSERFLKEIELTANLQHPHILPLFDSGSAEGLLYYVMPYVDGETLRARLQRETQLAMPDAVRITSEVADALDYAHKHGVIHRDIKPENVLLRDGHALLADFGIALAVREAGGNRLTQSGLSLGTPQYMSPEQATGNRQVDARSDVYSLAAVFYEMVAGEPPVSGATAQAMIAKLLTERPTALSVLRDTVPASVSDAVTKALAKTPADRYTTAGAFAGAIKAGFTTGAVRTGPRRMAVLRAGAGIVVGLGIAAVALMSRAGHRGAAYALGDRSQLTTTGDILDPAISGDGKQVAYFTKDCGGHGCSYSVVIQDVGSSTRRTILENATVDGHLMWSSDRRNLLVLATLNGVTGTYLLPTLGGAPRLIASMLASLEIEFAGSDSLLLGSGFQGDSIYWIRVASLDGVVHDSIRVTGPVGTAMAASIPGTPWIVTGTEDWTKRYVVWKIADRRGRVVDRAPSQCWCQLLTSNDALWLWGYDPGATAASPSRYLIRIPVDSATGRLGTHPDTMRFSGVGNPSITADGGSVAVSQGTTEYSIWALDLTDARVGRFADSKRIARASVPIHAEVSPDGDRIMLDRTFPLPSGGAEHRLTLMPFAGGDETAVTTQGKIDRRGWVDSITIALATVTAKGRRFVLHDALTGAEREEAYVPDSLIFDFDPVPGGWAWLPWGGQKVVTRVAGQTHEYPDPPWAGSLSQSRLDPTARRLALVGTARTNADSLGVFVLSLDTGLATPWAKFLAGDLVVQWLEDGSILAEVYESQGTVTLYHLSSPGGAERIGTIPREVTGIDVDRKMRRAVVRTGDFHGDAWVVRVVRR